MLNLKELEKYEYFKKTHPKTHNKAIFLDGFENNIVDAIALNTLNKTKQKFILATNINIESIKDALVKSGDKSSKIKVITKIEDIPFSLKKMSSTNLTEILYNILYEKYEKYEKDEISKMMKIMRAIFTDLKTKGSENVYINFQNLKEEFKNTKQILTEYYNLTHEFKIDNYYEIPTVFFENNASRLEYLNSLAQLEMIDNTIEKDVSYIININSKKDRIIIASILRRVRLMPEFNDLKTDFEDKTSVFIEFKDFEIESYITSACSEPRDLIVNLFLDEKSYIDGVYSRENIASFKVNLELCLAKNKSKLLNAIKKGLH